MGAGGIGLQDHGTTDHGTGREDAEADEGEGLVGRSTGHPLRGVFSR